MLQNNLLVCYIFPIGINHQPQLYAKHIKCPTLLLHGAVDKNVSIAEIETIYKNLSTKQKQLHYFKQAGHENYLKKYQQEWIDHVFNFLKM
jgi:uncharacterized protein